MMRDLQPDERTARQIEYDANMETWRIVSRKLYGMTLFIAISVFILGVIYYYERQHTRKMLDQINSYTNQTYAEIRNLKNEIAYIEEEIIKNRIIFNKLSK